MRFAAMMQRRDVQLIFSCKGICSELIKILVAVRGEPKTR
jgi:hypothetical protein